MSVCDRCRRVDHGPSRASVLQDELMHQTVISNMLQSELARARLVLDEFKLQVERLDKRLNDVLNGEF